MFRARNQHGVKWVSGVLEVGQVLGVLDNMVHAVLCGLLREPRGHKQVGEDGAVGAELRNHGGDRRVGLNNSNSSHGVVWCVRVCV